MDRNRTIIRTSALGAGVNLGLAALKLAVGAAAGSIAVILDAVNNLGDALSSAVTIVGTKLAGRRPDKKHPYGYGRIEYLTAVVVAVIVLAAGLTSLRESIEKILRPAAASYTAVSLALIAAAVVAKFLTGRHVKAVGERINAQSLVAAGSDAFFDAILTLATLAGGLLSMVWGLNVEGFLGAAISLVILKAGVEMLLEPLGSVIGARADRELTQAIRARVEAFPEVLGAYDLALHNYGPSELIGSVHIELPDDMTAREIHRLTRRIAQAVFLEFGVVLTVGVYASNTSGEEALETRRALEEVVKEYPQVLQVHGFYVEEGERLVSLDLVIDFAADAQETCRAIQAAMEGRYPGWTFSIVADSDYSD